MPSQNLLRPFGRKTSWCSKTFSGRDCRHASSLLYALCANPCMRKLIANSVLLLMLAVFFRPAFANAGAASFPACCRRGGVHHCTAVARALVPGEPSLRSAVSCPMWHGQLLVSSVAALPVSQSFAFYVRHEALIKRSRSRSYLSSTHSDSQRGPPELFL